MTMGSVVVRTLVYPFYRQNGGLLAFLFFIMVLAVGRANEAGLFEYHLSLIQGMLTTTTFLIFVLAAWLLYAWKCDQFVETVLAKPEFSFLYLLAQTDRIRAYRILLWIQVLLFLPVLSYVMIILMVGYRHHWYTGSTGVLIFNVGVCLGGAYRYMMLMRNPGVKRSLTSGGSMLPVAYSYSGFLIRYVLTTRKLLFLGIKLYSCGILYFTLLDRTADEPGRRMDMLFYSTGVLGHGVLIYLLREMEDSRLVFYRGLPVPAGQRLIRYAGFYLFLLIPEMVLLLFRVVVFLPISTALFFLFFSFSLLLLLNSLRMTGFDRKVDFTKMVAGLFLLVVVAVVSAMVVWLTLVFFLSAVGIFLSRGFDPGE